VVSEYAHVEAVRDKVNVPFWVVQIRTDGPEKLRCTEKSATRSRGAQLQSFA